MRVLRLVVALFVALCVLDRFVLDGRYASAAWHEANYHGQKFRLKVDHWLKRAFLPVPDR
jgi:hypothetical protein